MKLLFVTRESYQRAGARIRCVGFAQQLEKRGISTKVFSFIDDAKIKIENEDLIPFRKKIKLILKGLNFLQNASYDILVINRFNYHAISCWISSSLKKKHYVFDVDDWEFREDIGNYLGLFPKSKAEYLFRILSSKSKFCIASSHFLKEYLLQFNRNVYYLPTGIDINVFGSRRSYEDKKKIILSWHGTINRKETVEYLRFIIKCFRLLKEKYDNIELWIKGGGIFEHHFLKLLKKYNSKSIYFSPWGDFKSVLEYLDKVDIGLYFVKDRTKFNLAKFPTKILEYMAAKKPVVASKIGEAQYIITHRKNGLLAENNEEFIHYVEELIENGILREKMGKEGYQTVKNKYSLDVLGEKLFKIFKENFPQLL